MTLEKEVIDRRIALMEAEGICFRTGVDVGRDITAKELTAQFDRVILACGASNPRDISVPGRECSNIYFAVEYLTSVTKSLLDSQFADGKAISAKGKHVLVIGGGDTGNDCVGTAIRQGAKSVTQLEIMPMPPLSRTESNPWPQWPKVLKTDYGQEEAIAVFGKDPRVYETTVTEFIPDKKGNVKKAKIVSLKNMVPVPETEKVIDAELVLIAAGFLGSQKYVTDAFDLKLDSRTNVQTVEDTYQTGIPNVFAAGDMPVSYTHLRAHET